MKLIVEQVPIKASLFSNEPPARAGHVFVYQGKNNRYITIQEGQVLSRAEIRSNGIHYRYTVKKVTHSYTSSTVDIQSEDFGRNFRFHFNVDLTVVEADKVVQNNIENLENYFTNKVLKEFKPKISSYYFEQFNELKKEVPNFIHQTNIVSEMQSAGILVSNFTPTISLSTEDFNYFKELENIKKQHDINKRKIETTGTEEELKQLQEIQRRKNQLLFEAQEKKFILETEIEIDDIRNQKNKDLAELYKDDRIAQTLLKAGDQTAFLEYVLEKERRAQELEDEKVRAKIEMAKKLDPKDINYVNNADGLLNGNNRKDITPETKKITAGGPSNKWDYEPNIDLDDEEF